VTEVSQKSSSESPREASAGERAPEFSLRSVLEEMVRQRASDLHLKVGRPPVMRLHGDLHELRFPRFRVEDARRCADQILNPQLREEFGKRREADFAIALKGLGRFRVNIFQQRGTLSFAFRAIPVDVPSIEELHLPSILERIAEHTRGLVLVTGVTGSGKSTAMAAMIRHINEHRAVNVLTIEDPIEFLHTDQNSLISQREVGTDTLGFNEALRHVLRQDPDVIMLGEIRDVESMETVLKAASTGHLVLSALHTTDAPRTLNRIFSFFPPHEQPEVRELLAESLRAVISMRLLPRGDGAGRVPAVEIMVNTAAVAERIRTGNEMHTLPELIEEGRQHGMRTFDQSLMDLYRSGSISLDTALRFAADAADFKLRVSGDAAASDASWDTGLGG
jgi:twitching motility protein PilT